MKIRIQDPEFGDFDSSGAFVMHRFTVEDGKLVHSTGTGGEYRRRAVIDAVNVKDYVKQNRAAMRAKIDIVK